MPTPEQIMRTKEQRFQFLNALYDLVHEDPQQPMPTVTVIAERAGLVDLPPHALQLLMEPLAGDRLIKPIRTSAGFARVGIESDGMKQVEDITAGAGQVPAAPSISGVAVTGNGNVLTFAQASPGARQRVEVGMSAEHLEQLRDWVGESRAAIADSQLDEAQRAALSREADDLEVQINAPGADEGALRAAGRKFLAALVTASAGAAATQAAGALPAAIENGWQLFT